MACDMSSLTTDIRGQEVWWPRSASWRKRGESRAGRYETEAPRQYRGEIVGELGLDYIRQGTSNSKGRVDLILMQSRARQ